MAAMSGVMISATCTQARGSHAASVFYTDNQKLGPQGSLLMTVLRHSHMIANE